MNPQYGEVWTTGWIYARPDISKVVCLFNMTQFSNFYLIITSKREAK